MDGFGKPIQLRPDQLTGQPVYISDSNAPGARGSSSLRFRFPPFFTRDPRVATTCADSQTNDLLERTDPLTLATAFKGETGGFPYGSNRNANIGYPTGKERHAADPSDAGDPDILPGTHGVYNVDGPGGEAGTGYLWNGALRAGLPVHSYGVFARVYNLVHPKPEIFAGDGKSISLQSIAAYEDPNWMTLRMVLTMSTLSGRLRDSPGLTSANMPSCRSTTPL